ncbi:MAG: hypothetical protein PHY34_04750 [Patescibacteria group bacterium]|nr:hypothetical protein [Patescibacteria group bacterium]MDD5715622.1 hypothetical protein [Patescibacteria group bacterium]
MHRYSHNQGGYIALIAVLIIVAVTLAIGLALNLLGIGETQAGYEKQLSVQSFTIADSCMHEAYIRLRADSAYAGGSLNVGQGSCSITVTADGPNRTIRAASDIQGVQRKIESAITLSGTSVKLISWQEVSL